MLWKIQNGETKCMLKLVTNEKYMSIIDFKFTKTRTNEKLEQKNEYENSY